MHNEDIELAKMARLNAHSPYSNFQVGAVLRTKSGKIYKGCNIENHGIQGICAERTVFAKALSEGEREFECITIIGANRGEEPKEKCMPCGYCRQFISEFVDKNFKVCVVDKDNNTEEMTISELLPHSFIFEK
ncbi:MAG: cytidine deaminase [Clostridia bacterium]|nr:cytidine deaminase [Clostridia bacterium]